MQRGWIAEVRATASPAPAGRALAEMAPLGLRAVAWLLSLAVLVVAWRRLAGALVEPPDPPLLLAIGVAAAALAALYRRARPAARPIIVHPSALLPLAVLATLGAALSFAATPLAARCSFWGLLILEEVCTLWPRGKTRLAATPSTGAKPAMAAAGALPGGAAAARAVELPLATAPAREVVQQLSRSQAADGSELLSGFLRLGFAPLQRTASAHVAFCPPFKGVPRLEVRQSEGPAARVKTGQLLPYGVRLDLKLAAAADKPSAVLLQFTARWDANQGE
jgi:hypothetical protein